MKNFHFIDFFVDSRNLSKKESYLSKWVTRQSVLCLASWWTLVKATRKLGRSGPRRDYSKCSLLTLFVNPCQQSLNLTMVPIASYPKELRKSFSRSTNICNLSVIFCWNDNKYNLAMVTVMSKLCQHGIRRNQFLFEAPVFSCK